MKNVDLNQTMLFRSYYKNVWYFENEDGTIAAANPEDMDTYRMQLSGTMTLRELMDIGMEVWEVATGESISSEEKA